MSIEVMRPTWDKWSHGYPICEEDGTMYAAVNRGHKKLSGDSCILELFLKKTRASAAINANYNYSLIPDIVLHFPSTFYEQVADYRETEANKLQVCNLHVQLSVSLKLRSPMCQQRIVSWTR